MLAGASEDTQKSTRKNDCASAPVGCNQSPHLPTDPPAATRKGQTMSEDSLFERGLKVRKEVLGEDYVNKSIAGADEFTRTMAEWSTEFCWGALWTRPGFDRKSRSIVNLAMISVLNRPHELKLHVKAALKNGLTKDEIKEIFLQVAVYAGVPAGIDSFRIAREAFKEMENG
jgi:4-carboxymuconolactone decarboxylase